jgi:hypothetical protein
MSPDNVQGFIDQHPSLFAAIFLVYFITLWCLVGIITFSNSSNTSSVQRSKMAGSKRADAVVGELQQRVDPWSE